MTIGHFDVAIRTPTRQRDLVADLHHRRENVIEETESRRPVSDFGFGHPDRAGPTMFGFSDGGELTHRAEPKLLCRFAVTFEHAAFAFDRLEIFLARTVATSSPKTTMRGSRSISSCIHRLMRSTIVPAIPLSSAPYFGIEQLTIGRSDVRREHHF
jgi:hypothetical protein